MNKQPSAEHRADVRATGLDRDHLVAMGEVAYWSARVERTLSLVVMALVSDDDDETDEIGSVVTRGLSFTGLLELGAKLVKLQRFEGQVRDMFTRLASELKAAMESRNHLLHGDWTKPGPGPGPATASRVTARRTVDRTFTVEQVEDVAFELAVLSNQLFMLYLVVQEMIDYKEWFPES
ncbi:hypothetical protein FRIG_03610 [Frigoribacterium faeni]|uniref:hypothetical protein n=1 Tax=Frigoribacterium faeni TaxID=145483 RepID=UPI001FACEC2E|nr:hypothetical protein [Frigoribacterium faeni]MCJ0700228.1 hypothetical protein [Frigoribacterium faeni]